MPLPVGFQFSQSSLQDYVDCPRRFELRYVLQQAWPAVPTQPVLEQEQHLWRGVTFHRLVHQHTVGIPVEALTPSIEEDDDLRRWWAAYLDQPPLDLAGMVRVAEIALSTSLGGYRLLAKYDLVATGQERVVIIDWKTDKRRPAAASLARRLQTRVYPYVMVEAGASLAGMASLAPRQVAMAYWFAEYPGQVEWLAYDETQHQANRRYLLGLMDEIAARPAGDFPLTADVRPCRFCVYRSLCERGVSAGDMSELDETAPETGWPDLDIDLEQVAEMAY